LLQPSQNTSHRILTLNRAGKLRTKSLLATRPA
jgi:hypothetical protein